MMLKDWVKRLSGAGGVEFRLGQAYAVGQRDRQRLETELRTLASRHSQELAAREAEMAVMAKRIEALELRLHHASRFGVAAVWHALDRIDELRPPTRLTCLACATTTEADRFGRREDECIFDGGKLVRHECPGCGCVFGPMK